MPDFADVGQVTHEGVTLFSNTQSSEQMRADIDAGATGTPPGDSSAAATPATPAAPAKPPNPRKDLKARVDQLSGEVANKDQSIATLNERLAEIDTLKAQIAELKAPKAPAPIERPAAPPSTFADKEPTLEQFAQSDDPYRDYMRALSAFDRKKEAFDARQSWEQGQAERAATAGAAEFDAFVKTTDATHGARLTEFVRAHPEAQAAFEAAKDLSLTPLMYAAVQLSDQGPAFMLEMAQHPDLVDDLVLQTSNQLVFDAQRHMNPLVQVLQRRLAARVGAAVAGSAPARKTTAAHPPISPVAGSHSTPPSGPPGDDASYEEHEAYWNRVEREQQQAGRRR